MFLFLLGLLTGLAESNFANPRMGLAAHLEGLMNGTFLVVLGAVWTEVRLSARFKALTYWGVIYGTYGNWLITSLAALFGTSAMTPITAMGHRALPWQEQMVTFGFASIGIVIIVSLLLILWGLSAMSPQRQSHVLPSREDTVRP
jgi:(hydroxyamino)benzene mutase